jgi:[acyl-carrier-protein] S-malonyltransferase
LRASRAREHLRDHLTHPVLFQQSLEQLARDGATTYAELGCGGVLVGLVKRIDPTAQRFGVKDLASLDAFIQGAKNPSEPS